MPDRDDQIFVSPSVGVTHEPIERLVAGLTAQKTIRATLATNVGYLTPDHAYLMFTVAEDSDPAARIQELMSIVIEFALPWVYRHVDLDSFIADMAGSYSYIDRDSARLRRPAAYFLKGEFDKVRQLLSDGARELHEHDGRVAQEYRRFASSLLDRLEGRTNSAKPIADL